MAPEEAPAYFEHSREASAALAIKVSTYLEDVPKVVIAFMTGVLALMRPYDASFGQRTGLVAVEGTRLPARVCGGSRSPLTLEVRSMSGVRAMVPVGAVAPANQPGGETITLPRHLSPGR